MANSGKHDAPKGAKKVNPDATVRLVVVLENGHVHAGNVSGKMASDYIRDWWTARMWAYCPQMMEPPEGKSREQCHVNYKDWLNNATVALNVCNDDTPEETYAMSAWAVSEVIGMYAFPVELDDAEKERLRALKNMNEAAERERRERERDDKWRGSPDDDEREEPADDLDEGDDE